MLIPHVFFAVAALAIVSAAHGQPNHDAYPLMSVEQAGQQRDESRMSLEGVFLRQNRGEEDEFIFRDKAGDEILVYDRNAGREVPLNVPVIIEGAIDRGILLRTEFNLHRVVLPGALSEDARREASASAVLPAAGEARDGVFIHLSSGADNPRAVLMALTLAGAFVEDHPVLIYADLDAVSLFINTPPSVSSPGYLSAAERIPVLLEAGAMIRVCPTCLSAADLSSADLANGVALADKREFFSFTTGRILTFDY
jgi:uncharacterized protein YdeI (BOF family)/predicted peroxiredoxin